MRLVAYVRVSRVGGREGPSFISPALQRAQIEGWAAGRAEIIAWHEDLDVSGGTMERAGLDAAMEAVRSGAAGGIVVAKIDRFARSLGGALDAIAELESYGAAFVSVAEGLDPTTPAGKMMLRLLLVLGEFERDRIAESWAVARSRAVERGVHISSKVPVGYRRGDSGQLDLDPVAGPVVIRAFRAKAEGASWREVGLILEDAGIPTSYGGELWTAQSLKAMIGNRAYLGEARSGEFTNSDAHRPLIDPATFERAQRSGRHYAATGGALLSGLLRCAGCCFTMKPDHMRSRRGEKLRIYRCRGRFSFGECKARASVLGSVIEPFVVETFFDRIPDLRLAAVRANDELDAAKRVRERAELELVAFRDAESVLGTHYLPGLAERVRILDAAEARVLELQRAAGLDALPDVVTLHEAWEQMSLSQRRRVLSGGMDAVFLRSVRRRNVPIGERAVVLWRGEAPDDLPSLSRRGFTPREFRW